MNKILRLCLILLSYLCIQSRDSVNAFQPSLEAITSENINRLELLNIIGHGSFSSATLSPNGETLAVATTAGIWLYEFDNLLAKPDYLQHGVGFGGDVRFDQTGNYIEVSSYYPDVGTTVTQIYRLDAPEMPIDGILSNDGQYILHDSTAFDTTNQRTVRLELPEDEIFSPNINEIIRHPTESLIIVPKLRVVAYTLQNEIRLFDTEQNRYVASLQISNDETLSQFTNMVFSSDGEYIIGVVMQSRPSIINYIYKWSVSDLLNSQVMYFDDGEILWRRENERVYEIQNRDNFILVKTSNSESYQPTTELLNLLDGTLIQTINTHQAFFAPVSGNLINIQSETGYEWTVFDNIANESLGTLYDFGGSVRDITFNLDETQMLSINQFTSNNAINVLISLHDTEAWQVNHQLHLDNQIDTHISFQPDGHPIIVAVSGWDMDSEKRLDIRDILSGEILYSMSFESQPFSTLSDKGLYLFISTELNRWLYDLSTPQSPELIILPSNELSQTRAYFSPDSRYLILIEFDSENQLLRVWDIQAQQEVARITNRQSNLNPFVETVQWMNDNEYMVLCESNQLSFWAVETLIIEPYSYPSMTIPKATLCRIDSSQFHDYVVIPTYDFGVQNWLTTTNSNIMSYGINKWWRVAQFSPDGSIIFGIDYFGTMFAWNTYGDEENIGEYNISPWAVNSLYYIQNQSLMVLPAEDGTIRLWGILSAMKE